MGRLEIGFTRVYARLLHPWLEFKGIHTWIALLVQSSTCLHRAWHYTIPLEKAVTKCPCLMLDGWSEPQPCQNHGICADHFEQVSIPLQLFFVRIMHHSGRICRFSIRVLVKNYGPLLALNIGQVQTLRSSSFGHRSEVTGSEAAKPLDGLSTRKSPKLTRK